jgi:hypothetical protein
VFAPLALSVGAVLLCRAATADERGAPRPVDPQVRGGEVTRTSRPIRLLRSWQETIKAAAGREYVRRVELVFDYRNGVAREDYYTLEGKLAGSREIRQNQPSPSPEEIAEAKNLILSDRELARIVERRAAVLEGGFLLEENRGLPCGPGSRCLQIQLLSPDRSGLVRWTVVDLVSRRIPYPVHVPSWGSR